jgi:hypothetical protein
MSWEFKSPHPHDKPSRNLILTSLMISLFFVFCLLIGNQWPANQKTIGSNWPSGEDPSWLACSEASA